MLRSMTDTPETQPVEGAEILRTLRKIETHQQNNARTLNEIRGQLADIAAQLAPAEVTGGLMPPGRLTEVRQDLAQVIVLVSSMSEVVQRAAPLLNSGPARALAGGGGMLQALRGGRRAAAAGDD